MKNHMLVQFDGQLIEASCLYFPTRDCYRWSLTFKDCVVYIWVAAVCHGIPAERHFAHDGFVRELRAEFPEAVQDSDDDLEYEQYE